MKSTEVFVIGTPDGVELKDAASSSHGTPSTRSDQSGLVNSTVTTDGGSSVYQFELALSEITNGDQLIWGYGSGASFGRHSQRGVYGTVELRQAETGNLRGIELDTPVTK